MIYDLQDTNKICQGFSVLAILITLHNRRENPQKNSVYQDQAAPSGAD